MLIKQEDYLVLYKAGGILENEVLGKEQIGSVLHAAVYIGACRMYVSCNIEQRQQIH